MHYKNLLKQHTENFRDVKIETFHSKRFDIFNMFARNLDCGYTLKSRRALEGIHCTNMFS